MIHFNSGAGAEDEQNTAEGTPAALDPGDYRLPSKETLEQAHHALIIKYIGVLRRTSNLKSFEESKGILPDSSGNSWIDIWVKRLIPFIPQPFDPSILRNFNWKFLIRIFVESHIKSKLNQISHSYVQMQQLLRAEKNRDDLQGWLQESEEGTTKLASTLTAWTSLKTLLGVWLPLLLAGLYAILGVGDLTSALPELYKHARPLGGSLFLIVGYLGFPFYLSFSYKRWMFIPGYGGLMNPAHDPPSNVYQLENKLFDLLPNRKRREFPLDILALAISSFAFGVFILTDSRDGLWNRVGLIVGLLLVVSSVSSPLLIRNRPR